MAQDFAPLLRSIWTDDDFRALSMDAQHIYMMLFSHPDRNSAGVLSLTLRKWTRLAADLTPDRLDMALAELDATTFIVVDESTEELLVRSFIRRASVYKHIRMLANALREASEIESPRLRSVLARELGRLPRLALPDNPKMKAEAEAAQRRVDEMAETPSPPNGPGQGDAHPMAHGMADGMAHPLAHPTVVVAGAVAGAGAGAPPPPKPPKSEGGSHVSSGSPAQPPLYPDEPRYDLDSHSWTHACPCIKGQQRDPDCPWHGRQDQEPTAADSGEPISDRSKGAARTVGPVADHRSERSAPAPLYSDRCTRHGNDAEPGNCGACKDARLANATRRPLAVVRETQHCWVHDLDYIKRCNGCEADRKAAPEEETA